MRTVIMKIELFNLYIFFQFNLNEVDITAKGNEALFDLYKYDIPVIHLNGKEIMRHRVFENVLLDALQLIEEMNKQR